jgi:hypothetical protein
MQDDQRRIQEGVRMYRDHSRPFSLFDQVQTDEPREVSLQRSSGTQSNELSRAFYSPKNIAHLQTRLQQEIKKQMGLMIDRQSEEELTIVMRYVYMMHSRNTGGRAELERLNELVLREVVPNVGANVAMYLTYLRDASTLPTPLARGQATSVKGTKTMELFRPLKG